MLTCWSFDMISTLVRCMTTKNKSYQKFSRPGAGVRGLVCSRGRRISYRELGLSVIIRLRSAIHHWTTP
jgi:translation initiation factor IF-3